MMYNYDTSIIEEAEVKLFTISIELLNLTFMYAIYNGDHFITQVVPTYVVPTNNSQYS